MDISQKRSKRGSAFRGYILLSACLGGFNCTHKASGYSMPAVQAIFKKYNAICVCPEMLGGLGIPRPASEIRGGSGEDVLAKKAFVITADGEDVSKNFIHGANLTLKLAKIYAVKLAVLKSLSPSCGFGKIYDGSFKKIVRSEDGVTTAMLKKNKIEIISENELKMRIKK